MDNSNINEGNANILSGTEQGADSPGKTDQDKENINVLKNEQLEAAEKAQPSQEIDDSLQRSGQQNENDHGKYLQLCLTEFTCKTTFADHAPCGALVGVWSSFGIRQFWICPLRGSILF